MREEEEGKWSMTPEAGGEALAKGDKAERGALVFLFVVVILVEL